MRILYVAPLSPNDSALYRLWALEREGNTVLPIDILCYGQRNPLLRKLEHRLVLGPEVDRLNRDILTAAREHAPDILWADKALWITPETLEAIRKLGIQSVSYMIDNFFGPRRDPGWRLYAKTIPSYDLHCTQRDKNVSDYLAAGARNVLRIQTAFEPTIHFPPSTPYTDARRNRGISFLGTPYDRRGEILTHLHTQGLPVVISGNPRQWRRALTSKAFTGLYREGELFGQHYREAVWRSQINLSFLTHSNGDEFAHKSFEITACGGFLLAERSQGHLDRFIEDEEAVFFSTDEELAVKIRHYLPDQAARNRIAAAGERRAWASGYDNDTQVRRIINRLHELGAPRPASETRAKASR